MQDLSVTLIQSELQWEDIEGNLSMLEDKIRAIDSRPDVILLPEMFSTGFTMSAARLAESPGGKTLSWMREMSDSSKALIIGSIIVKEDGRFFNRLHAVEPNGEFQIYDKRHLFRMAREDDYYNFGSERIIIEWKDWKILPLVCYDLRFPVWSRNSATGNRMEYDLLVYVANWPEARVSAWDSLLQARAIENLAYCAGVNRSGLDGNGISFIGHSACYGPRGEEILLAGKEEVIETITLSHSELNAYREKFPAYLDADLFEIK